jgi:phosphatidylglycerol---prolipoprotein diacylglyceryl transferase
MSPGSVAHLLLELLGYAVGARWYWRNVRAESATSPRPDLLQRWAIVAGAAFGAALCSKLLYVLQYWAALQPQPAVVWWSGKTIVGGLLGGLLGVELAKRAIGWRRSTGDAFVGPLIAGMILGRLGCQLAGLEDLTYGGVTTLPWGWDYGDGLPRHPVALYEICGLLLIGALVSLRRTPFTRTSGDRFRAFMIGYLLLRLLLDYLKPPHAAVAVGQLVPGSYGPFTAIQWACVCGLAYYLPTAQRWLRGTTQ